MSTYERRVTNHIGVSGGQNTRAAKYSLKGFATNLLNFRHVDRYGVCVA
jgi:hypothetical protein